jgi:hypothetical protein
MGKNPKESENNSQGSDGEKREGESERGRKCKQQLEDVKKKM